MKMIPGDIQIPSAILAELTATCDALGYNDGNKVYLDKNSIEVIKDLIRYLRRDDDTHSIRRYLGQSEILQKDLLKIFVEHSDKIEFWNILLRLLINLTSPVLMIYNEELPAEKITRSYYLQILSHLQQYKKAMANDAVWMVVHEKLKNVLSIESSERGEENSTILERILILIRNILRVPPSDYDKRMDNDTTVHDEVLFALHTSGISDLLVYIASTNVEQQYHMQILEIVSFLLQGQNPVKLAKAEMQRSAAEKEYDEDRLTIMREKEKSEKISKMKKYAGSRHSRFGGTYVVQNMKAIGDNEMLCHKPYQKIEDLNFSVTKQKMKKRKNNSGIMSFGDERVSALSVRLFLKEFCVEFLNGAYNPVMSYARSCIIGGNYATVDASHYLWALHFFMSFNRHYKFRVKYVSETISTEVFYIVQRQIEHNYEMINIEKKKVTFWSTRLHLALKAYQELLYTLIEMDKSTDSGVKNSSRVIMGNIFYVPEYRDTILSQLLNYNELIMSRDYLVDLVTTVHIFLKMLKNYCDKQQHLIVQKIKRKQPKKKAKPRSSGPSTAAVGPPPSWEDRWDVVGPEVSAVMQQNAIPEVIPFDATIATPIDEQKSDAMKRIQKLLRNNNHEHAIGLLRSAREVWPENDSFGKADMAVEEEFLVLREIFLADLGVPDEIPPNQSGNKTNDENITEESIQNDEEESEEIAQPRVEESNFKFMDFLQRFANVRIVSNLTILLKQFEKNTPEVNHCVLKLFHRIAMECKMPAMMYQASIFRVFQRVFQYDSRMYKDLTVFAHFIFRGFVEVAKRNPKAYMELLFWKSTKQAIEMTEGYDTEHSSNKKTRNVWSDAEEDELRTLFMEHQTKKLPQDLISYILENLINQDRTRRGVMKKLKEMCLIVNSKSIRGEIQKRLPKEWSDEEINQLTELWDQVKEEHDPVGLIYDSLRIKRSKAKIKEKLLELNLAENAQQLRKKRMKKSSGPKSSWENPSNSENEDSSDSEINSESDDGQTKPAAERKQEKKLKNKKNKQASICYTDAQLSGLLKDVIDNGMQETLRWLKESLEESLEDRDEETAEGLALVPLTAETSSALETASLQRLLRALGIEPPNAEEFYWRIPASMLVTTIKKRCETLEAALRGEFLEEETVRKKKDDSESDDEDIFEKLKKYSERNDDTGEPVVSEEIAAGQSTSNNVDENSKSSTSGQTDSDTNDNNSSHDTNESIRSENHANASNYKEDDTNLSAKSQIVENKPNTKRIRAVLESSESEDEFENSIRNEIESTDSKIDRSKYTIESGSEDENMEIQSEFGMKTANQSSGKEGSAKSSRIRKVVDSDSDDTETVSKNMVDSKRDYSEGSDIETSIPKKRRVYDSDEDDAENDLSVGRKPSKAIIDDDD
ncbi:PREDICTED: protein timeless homolog [Ceratosolen solmsi marchali]|uniref:Protein timeless homolog n=1 Tax=Ceratosolen solmsi marchali TaxID=326594 RepID=A0AAJ6YKV4_9HYME|nr:PREDICTED: protein timeless homolog [Ceratosolen solmsi marchali]